MAETGEGSEDVASEASVPAEAEYAVSGAWYERELHSIIGRFAARHGDQYTETGTTPGRLSRSKKGDGLLAVLNHPGAAMEPRVVVEVTVDATHNRDWASYLDESMTNRSAQAAVGVICGAKVPGGGRARWYGANKLLVAFDPRCDPEDLVEFALHLLRWYALTIACRRRADQVASLAQLVAEAQSLVDQKISAVITDVSESRRRQNRALAELDALQIGLLRLLMELFNDLEES